jgi:hypothetical protein
MMTDVIAQNRPVIDTEYVAIRAHGVTCRLTQRSAT